MKKISWLLILFTTIHFINLPSIYSDEPIPSDLVESLGQPTVPIRSQYRPSVSKELSFSDPNNPLSPASEEEEIELPGDGNGDGIVDNADYILWRKNSGRVVELCTNGDFDCNGKVNEKDYDLWKANFGKELPPLTFTISAFLNEAKSAEVTINVDQTGKADINYYGETYQGKFDRKNNQILIQTSDGEITGILDFQFSYNKSFVLKSINAKYQIPSQILAQEYGEEYADSDLEIERHFGFNQNGIIERNEYIDKFRNKSIRQLIKDTTTYVEVGGWIKPNLNAFEVLVEDDQGIVRHTRYKDIMSYDSTGRSLGYISLESLKDRNYTLSVRNQYLIKNEADLSGSYAGVEDVDLYDQIDSIDDYTLIDQYADTKYVSYFKDNRFFEKKFEVEYGRYPADGELVPKKVTTPSVIRSYIVQGMPDQLVTDQNSNDPKDILINEFNSDGILLTDYSSYYEEVCEEYCRSVYRGYGLALRLNVFNEEGKWRTTTAFIDYPNQNYIELKGKKFPIRLNDKGIFSIEGTPTLNPIGKQTVAENTNISFTIKGTDPENQSLTYYLIDEQNSSNFAGDLPKGAHIDPMTGVFSWTPTFDQAGTYSILFGVGNGDLYDFERVTFVVQNTNLPPIATEERFDTKPNQSIDIFLPGMDPDGESLMYEVNVLPQHGALTSIVGNDLNHFIYIPNEGFTGFDEFYYRVFDGTLWSEEKRIGIDVLNEPPVGNFSSIPVFEWITSQQKTITGTIDVIDVNLSDTYTMIIVDQPDHGGLKINGSSYTYTPTPGYFGDETFTFQAKNNRTGERSHIQTGQIHGLYGLSQTAVVIDSGVDYLHSALGNNFGSHYRVVAGFDFADNDSDPFDDATSNVNFPGSGHGTHVAGIIGSNHPVFTGVAPLVDLAALRALDEYGSGETEWLEKSLEWVINEVTKQKEGSVDAIKNPITAVNMSLGYGGNFKAGTIPSWAALEDELKKLDELGIFVSIAAGNSFESYKRPGLSYPGSSPYAFPVMSVDTWTTGLSYFSQRHDAAISADGYQVMSTVPDYAGNNNGIHDDFKSYSGTSMAAPFVAGASVLIREIFEYFGNEVLNSNIDEIIFEHMRRTADVIWDKVTESTYLRLNLERAIDSLFHPEKYDLKFKYLTGNDIKFGLASAVSSVVGLGAAIIEELS